MKSTSAYAKMKKKITESNSMSSPVRNIHKLKKKKPTTPQFLITIHANKVNIILLSHTNNLLVFNKS